MSDLLLKLEVDDHIYLAKPEMYMAEELYHVIQDNMTHLKPFLDFIDESVSIKDEENYLRMMLRLQAEGKGRVFIIYYDNQLIGTVDIHNVNTHFQRAEVGYWITQAFSGKNIITRCLKVMCDFVFTYLNINKLMLFAEVDNTASNKVATKAHFQYVGQLREHLLTHGHFKDANQYELLKADYYKMTK